MRVLRRMPRMQVYLPDDLYEQLKSQGLPASELLQDAVRKEVRRRALLAETDTYLAELDAEVGEATPEDVAEAEAWASRIRDHLSGRPADGLAHPRLGRTRAGTGSAVDALVVAVAEPGGIVITGDVDDLGALAAHARGVLVQPV